MNGLVMFLIFTFGWVAGVLTMMWGEDDQVPDWFFKHYLLSSIR